LVGLLILEEGRGYYPSNNLGNYDSEKIALDRPKIGHFDAFEKASLKTVFTLKCLLHHPQKGERVKWAKIIQIILPCSI